MQSHRVRLVQALTMISLDREAAADAAQEAFIQLFLHWDNISEYRDPVAWLYRVGINRCKDYRRFMSRTARVVERLGAAQARQTEEGELVESTGPGLRLGLSVAPQAPAHGCCPLLPERPFRG